MLYKQTMFLHTAIYPPRNGIERSLFLLEEHRSPSCFTINIKAMKKLFLILPFVLFTLSINGCKDDENENPLIGSKWKLVGFVDDQTGITREPQPDDCKQCYLLFFDTNDAFSGYSSTNTLNGTYSASFSSHTIQFTKIGGTKAGELYDGYEFVSSLSNVTHFTLSTEELKLFYNDNLYLLFNPYSP